ncbi:HAD-IC family P-type ATPase [Streptomyces sp. NBC_01497]|uniref:HAD-IC family P-type ATPase n=1 Tax=Streptomyces sp. NBC_01497 TaxID=2903885 RepID=UPI002E36F96C|nr:HAD-IC family P-type ATPase [Streptomyces sp. NBC_01497]
MTHDGGAELDPVHPVPLPPPPDAGVPASARRGLTGAEVARRVARGEVNDVPVRSSRSFTEIVRANVLTRFNAIIGVLWLLVLFVAPFQDSLFGYVIVANTAIGMVQEWRAKKTLDSLAVLGESRPTVRRDGTPTEVPVAGIVLGDIIELGPGDKIVVDGSTVEADGLEVDESLLTGEADPVLKRAGEPVMSGSFVVAGSGAFRAERVGREAYAAQLAEEASRFTLVDSELRGGISLILKYVTWLMVPTAVALIISQLVTERHALKDAIARTVGGIVPMIPEGLVLLTSVAFAIGVVRLGRRQCLVQELPAIEGLARVDTVCLDKTGTLTEGGMDVSELHLLGGAGRATAAGAPEDRNDPDDGEDRQDRNGPDDRDRDEAYVRRVLGALGAADPRPNASLRAVVAAYPAPQGWRSTDVLPFSSARKYSGAVLTDESGVPTGWLLGAPDVLLRRDDPALPEADERAARGLRVLLLARRDDTVPRERTGPDGNGSDEGPSIGPDEGPSIGAGDGGASGPGGAVRPVALVVLRQRLRSDAAATLAYFAEQNVAAKVISGDNAVSVGAVAAQLGLPGADRTVDARRLPANDPARTADALEAGAVFGRVTPRQKRDMVAALQSKGHTVAMTGDGVNDVLALKDADIGVAMGSGAEATRAVAQIVLLDNSFATLPSVVAEGRRVIGNITRVATLFLTKTVYSVLLAVFVVCFQVPYPFLPRHLTLLSTLTIGVPAFFLALAPNHERARPHFVRRVLRYSVPSGVIAAVTTFTTYLLARHYSTGPDTLGAETSAATVTLFLVSLWVLAIIARPYTWWRLVLVAAMAAAFLLVLAVPSFQRFFALKLVGETMPWTAVGIAAVGGVLLEAAWWWIARRTVESGT